MYHHGGEVYDKKITYDFSVNTNPFGMPASVQKYLQSPKALQAAAKYPQNGNGQLRSVLAEKEQVKEKQVLCGNGASELIYAVFRSMKGKVLLCTPGFSEYEQAAKVFGWEIAYFAAEESEQFAITARLLDCLKKEKPDLFVLCNPANPVGKVISKDFLFQIYTSCKKQGIFFLVDECFLPFLEDWEEKSAGRLLNSHQLQKQPILLILRAFTKTYAMAGLRLGYLLSANETLLEKIGETLPDWNVSTLAQQAGILALREEAYLEETRIFLRQERECVSRQLLQLGLTVFGGEANFLFWKGPEGLQEKLLSREILIRKCDNYRGLEQPGQGMLYYRTAILEKEANGVLIEALREALCEGVS